MLQRVAAVAGSFAPKWRAILRRSLQFRKKTVFPALYCRSAPICGQKFAIGGAFGAEYE